jgi:hypothetical protein
VNVVEALGLIRRVGEVHRHGDSLRLMFPERERTALQPAIDTLRSCKAEALALLAKSLAQRQPTALRNEPARTEPIESVLKGRAIELWSTASGRLFLVADEDDAHLAMERLGIPRGELYTAAEVRQIAVVKDPAVVAEVHDWKQRFDGVVREYRWGLPT